MFEKKGFGEKLFNGFLILAVLATLAWFAFSAAGGFPNQRTATDRVLGK